jgi:hypothetical protein
MALTQGKIQLDGIRSRYTPGETDNDFPQSVAEAKEHIASIRRQKGLDGPEPTTSDLDALLVLYVVPLSSRQ